MEGERFMEWAILPLRKYADFTGRARRKEYWLFTLFLVVASFLAGILDAALFGYLWYDAGPAGLIFMLGTLVPSLAVSVRRLHDVDRTGWWLLLALVPILGWIVLLVFAVQEGSRGPNRFGEDPLAGERLEQAAVN